MPRSVRLAELIAMISLGTDLGMGQPMEHQLRQTLIALRLAERAGAGDATRRVVSYASLVAWVGCTVTIAVARDDGTARLTVSDDGNKLIAQRLGISGKTVNAHPTNVFQAIGVTDRTQAALWAERHGLV